MNSKSFVYSFGNWELDPQRVKEQKQTTFWCPYVVPYFHFGPEKVEKKKKEKDTAPLRGTIV